MVRAPSAGADGARGGGCISPFPDIDHDLAGGRSIFHGGIGFVDRRECKAARIEARFDLSGFDQPGGFLQDFAMMGAAFAGQ